MSKGLFITFEGPEGAGKSTQISLLADALNDEGHVVERLRDPGCTHLGEELRNLVKYLDGDRGPCKEAELFMFAAARVQMVEKRIKPVLDEGRIVLCDRFSDSTMAYQGYARGFPLEHINQVNEIGGGMRPDLTILLDLTVEQSIERQKIRGEVAEDRFESLGKEFHTKVRNGFLEVASQEPDRFVVINAYQEKDIITSLIKKAVMDKI